ncbi:MAG: helix-turn-helix transcriptional regulator [Bacteroidetes bacterium]|nr:helix-turn-helix transcriptional regulator [Bacteroidota bacterium]
MNIGQKIKELIELRRLNKADFARQMGMSEQNLYKIFKKRSIDAELLMQMANLLNVRVSSFFEEEFSAAAPIIHGRVDDAAVGYGISKPAMKGIPQETQTYIQQLEQEVAHLKEVNLLKDELINALKRG